MSRAWLDFTIGPGLSNNDSKTADDTSVDVEELAFAELIVYIDEFLEVEEPAILMLSDLVRYYTSKLQELGIECGKVNTKWLKERVFAPFPDLTAHVEHREIQLVSQHEIGTMLSKVKKTDADAVCLVRAAHIVRREILKIKKLLQRHQNVRKMLFLSPCYNSSWYDNQRSHH